MFGYGGYGMGGMYGGAGYGGYGMGGMYGGAGYGGGSGFSPFVWIILVLIVLQWFRVGSNGFDGIGGPGGAISPEGSLVRNGGLFIIAIFLLAACGCFKRY